MDEIQVNTENTNLEVDLEVDDEYNKRKEEEEIEDKKIDSVNNNYEKFPHNCQAEIFNDKNGTILSISDALKEEISNMKYLIEYMNNNNKKINL